jgi:hypothetical protein
MGLGIKIPRNALAAGRDAYAQNPTHGENVTLEPGEYLGLLAKLKAVDTKKGPQLVADITVGENENNPEAKGGSVSLWFSFEEERIVHLFRFLKSLGYGDRLEDLDEDALSEIAEEIPGKNIVLKFRSNDEGFIRLKKAMDGMTAEEIGLEENAAKPTKGKGKPAPAKAAPTPGKKAPAKADDDAEPVDDTPAPKKDAPAKGKGKTPAKDEDEAEPADAEEDETIVLKVGLVCKAKIKGEDQEVKILKLLEDEGKVIAQILETGEKFKVKAENLS